MRRSFIYPYHTYIYVGNKENNHFLVKHFFTFDVMSGSDITSCIEINKPLVVYIFSNFMQ